MRFIDFFAGIGGFRLGMEMAGHECDGQRHIRNSKEITEDKVTGYTGRVTAVCDYYGERPTSYLVESMDRTGRPVEQWVDEQRLVEA